MYKIYFLKEIRRKGFKVSISGTGADELFTGYYDHYLLQLSDLKNSHLFNEKLKNWKENIKLLIRNKYLRNYKLYFKKIKNFISTNILSKKPQIY